MPPSTSQSSFIPKRGTASSKRRKPVRQIFLFSILAYSLIFATLLAAGGSYLYENYLTSQMQTEITGLNSEINTFSVSDLSRVSEFDLTLRRAADRFNNTASVVTLLQSIDAAAAAPIQIESLQIERVNDSQLTAVATIVTDTFDGALFQRKILNADQAVFTSVVIDEVTVGAPADVESGQSTAQVVTFTATLEVPIETIPYQSVTSRPTPITQTTNQPSL